MQPAHGLPVDPEEAHAREPTLPALAVTFLVAMGVMHCRSWEIALLRLRNPLDAAMGQRHMTEART